MINSKKNTFVEEYKVNSVVTLADLINISYPKLIYFTYVKNEHEKYHHFSIPKKRGGVRRISSPIPPVKYIQKNLSFLLSEYYGKRRSVHGFVEERNIVTNAQMHLKKDYILKIDLKEFFPSINYGRVFGLLIKHPYSLPRDVAALISKVTTYEGSLPQGSPASPVISNMICAQLDHLLLEYCKRNKITYTRYADDLTFSRNQKIFSEKIIDRIIKIISHEGFRVNFEKMRLLKGETKKIVTGVKVNEKPNVSRLYIRNIRAIIHSIEKDGVNQAEKIYFKKYERHRATMPDSFINSLRGKIEFIGMVRGKEDTIYLRLKKRLNNSISAQNN